MKNNNDSFGSEINNDFAKRRGSVTTDTITFTEDEKKAVEAKLKSKAKKKKYISIVVSVILAIGLWFYVINDENPTIKRSFSDVPVEFLNTETLTDKDLALVDTDGTTVRIELEGKRANLMDIEKKDIVASVDVSSFSQGDNYADVSVHVPSSVSVSEINPAQVKISIESINSEEKEIDVVFSGDVPDGKEAVCVSLSTEIVNITGAKSRVAVVDHLVADINTSKLTEESQVFESSLTPVDQYGHKVAGITVSVNSVKITAQLYDVKTVNLTVDTVGSLPDNLELASVDVASTIHIAGPSDELQNVDEILAEPLDLSAITASTEVEVKPDLPGNIRLASSQKTVKATITVKKRSTNTISYAVDDIALENIPDGYETQFTVETVSLEITGNDAALTSVSSADFTLSLDCNGLTEGTNSVTIKITLSNKAEEAGITVKEPAVAIELIKQ